MSAPRDSRCPRSGHGCVRRRARGATSAGDETAHRLGGLSPPGSSASGRRGVQADRPASRPPLAVNAPRGTRRCGGHSRGAARQQEQQKDQSCGYDPLLIGAQTEHIHQLLRSYGVARFPSSPCRAIPASKLGRCCTISERIMDMLALWALAQQRQGSGCRRAIEAYFNGAGPH